MLYILEGVRPGENELLDQAFRLRHQTFVVEKKWSDMKSYEGREIDQFDGVSAVYLIVTKDSTNQVIGNLRLLPTWKPHLLSEVHSHIWSRPYPKGPTTWEWTRYTIAPSHRGGKVFGEVASQLTIGAVEWGLANDVRNIVVEYHPYLVPRFGEMGFKVLPLGLPVELEGDPVIAVQMSYDETTLAKLRSVRGVTVEVSKETLLGERITGQPLKS